MSANRAKLLAATDTILPEDDTRVRDATLDGINAVTAHLDRDAINAVVLLTDGEDTSSNHSAYDVLQALERQRSKETGQIRVFTIAYGSDPNEEELAAVRAGQRRQELQGRRRRHRLDLPVDQLLLLGR